MTDFAAEQEEELEALAAIFQDEFVPDEHQPETKFSIVINDLDFLSSDIVIDFKYTDTYPDAPPEFAIQPTNQLLPDLKTRAMEAMAAAAAEDPGEVCVFNIVTAAKEWLTENFDADNEVRASLLHVPCVIVSSE